MAICKIIWDDNTETIFECATIEDAERAEESYRMAFGNQIAWTASYLKR